MFKSITFEQLFNLPSLQTLVLTANNRLSVFIKSQYLEHDRKQRKTVSLPDVVPYKAWLMQLGQQMSFYYPNMSLILNETAQQWYWRQTLGQVLSDEQKKSFNISATAAMLSQARHLQNEWDIQVYENERNPEYDVFEQWLEVYQHTLRQQQVWDSADMNDALLDAVQQGCLRVPRWIVLVGFYGWSPYQQKLLQAFMSQGTQVVTLDVQRPQARQISICQTEDAYQEVQGALEWLLHQAENSSYGKPARLALVVPNLQQEAPRLQRIIRRSLRGTVLENHWHMAVGRPLTEWGLVRSIVKWFTLIVAFRQPQGVSVELVGEALLNAEFAFTSGQRDALALWDSQLREFGPTTITLTVFCERLRKIAPERAETFKQAVETWFTYRRRCADWIQLYRDTLLAFAFPGEQLSSVNYQLCHAFEQALKSFSVLDEMLPSMNAEEALQLFCQHLASRTFQAKRQADVRLDIIGLYELEGGKWDAVWTLGLTDDVLPQRPSPNPYIPIQSQRRVQVTHSTPESEMQWAKQIFDAILCCAPILQLSYPKTNNDVILRPSSLLKPYLVNQKVLQTTPFMAKQNPQMEFIEDKQGLPKQGMMQGGYGLLERQSRNPLWAYAVARLGLKALAAYPETDLTVFVKGNFLHKVMELFYAQLCSQDLLYDDVLVVQTLNQALEQASEIELRNVRSPALKSLIIDRTRELVQRFIAFDRDARRPFDVFARESTYSFDAHGIYLNFKVDRIDKVNDGAWLFIDYKSGKIPTLKECYERWVGRERLIDLQLPLYASVLEVAEHHEVEGVTFASLARGNVFYEGLWQSEQYDGQKPESILPSHDWLNLNQIWQTKIDRLFAELAQGEASNRYYQEDDMDYCEIRPFLRLHAVMEEEGEE